MLAKKEDETVMQLKKVTSKATEELPKQDRKQQVQESARKQGGKKHRAWVWFTWVAM